MTVKTYNEIIGANKEKELLEALKARNLYLKKIITEKEKTIAKAPEGLLRISRSGNRIQYYYRTDPKDFNGEYIKDDNCQLACKLAQKDYDSRVLKIAEAEIKLTKKYEKLLEKNMISDVYESLHDGRRRLIVPTELSSEQFLERWTGVSYEPMSVSEDISFYSTCGVRVRSKSELIIANMLEQKGIPYRYEYPITLKGQEMVRPDFMCLNVSTRQEPQFKLYLIREFDRLKTEEQAQIGWNAKRELSKINYRIHTDAIKEYLIPAELTKQQISIVYANEADVLNMALFGVTAKQWRETNPDKDGNIRNYAGINELICLSNMENINALLIEEGMAQSERLKKLNQIAIHQMSVLNEEPANRQYVK